LSFSPLLTPGLFHSLLFDICQEDNLTQRRKGAKKNHLFRIEGAKISCQNCQIVSILIFLTLAILTILGNETALLLTQ
jgi:hypothetical protein